MTFGEGFWNWIIERSKVQFYVIFAFVWAALHWQTWITLFFVSETEIVSKYALLKVEYIKGHLNLLVPQSWGMSDGNEYWLNFALSLLVAFAVAFLMVWFIPKLLLVHFYDKERGYEHDKDKIDLKYEKLMLEEKKENVVVEKEIVQKQKAIATSRNTIRKTDKTVLWKEEFDEFRKTPYFGRFKDLIEVIYQYSGRWWMVDFESTLLSYLDAAGLTTFLSPATGSSRRAIELTEKGRYFVQQYHLLSGK